MVVIASGSVLVLSRVDVEEFQAVPLVFCPHSCNPAPQHSEGCCPLRWKELIGISSVTNISPIEKLAAIVSRHLFQDATAFILERAAVDSFCFSALAFPLSCGSCMV